MNDILKKPAVLWSGAYAVLIAAGAVLTFVSYRKKGSRDHE